MIVGLLITVLLWCSLSMGEGGLRTVGIGLLGEMLKELLQRSFYRRRLEGKGWFGEVGFWGFGEGLEMGYYGDLCLYLGGCYYVELF